MDEVAISSSFFFPVFTYFRILSWVTNYQPKNDLPVACSYQLKTVGNLGIFEGGIMSPLHAGIFDLIV